MMNNFSSSFSLFPMFSLGVGLFTIGALLLLLTTVAIIALKGYALWHAARRDDRGWFIALLIINTLGILELIYLYSVVGLWKTNKDESKNKEEEKK